jgi:hypothetical protein
LFFSCCCFFCIVAPFTLLFFCHCSSHIVVLFGMC